VDTDRWQSEAGADCDNSFEQRGFEVDFAFIDHCPTIQVDNGIPFEADDVHASYDPMFVNR